MFWETYSFKLTLEYPFQTGRGIHAEQIVLQESRRSNEGAVVFEMVLDFEVVAATSLVDGFAGIALDGVS